MAQKSYHKNHPVVSFRLPKEQKQRLEKIVEKEDTSVSEWVSIFLEGKMDDEEEKIKLKEELDRLSEEMKQLKEEKEETIRFTVPCSACGKPIIFEPSLPNWETDIYPQLKRCFRNWRHGECSNRYR